MMGVDAAEAPAGARRAVTSLHLGGVFLSGRSQGGTAATRAVVDSLTGLVGPESTGGAPLLVSTDQEGGDVQVLRGPGFSTIPSALKQSEQSAADLETAAAGWGGELAQAGVTMNLAPVADLVDIADPDSNEPIGAWGRQYGNDKETVITPALEGHVLANHPQSTPQRGLSKVLISPSVRWTFFRFSKMVPPVPVISPRNSHAWWRGCSSRSYSASSMNAEPSQSSCLPSMTSRYVEWSTRQDGLRSISSACAFTQLHMVIGGL